MKKIVLTHVIVALVFATMLFLIGSFIDMSINLNNWARDLRVSISIIFGIGITLLIIRVIFEISEYRESHWEDYNTINAVYLELHRVLDISRDMVNDFRTEVKRFLECDIMPITNEKKEQNSSNQ